MIQIPIYTCIDNTFFSFPATSKADDKEDIAMYVGLCVAIAVFATVVVIIVIVIRRRSIQHNGMFDMALPNGGELVDLRGHHG